MMAANVQKADPEGWVKLWRKLKKDALWKCSCPAQKVVMITLLMMVNHEENEWIWKGMKFKVGPGQLITSIKTIMEEVEPGISIRQVRTALQNLVKYGFMTNQSTKTGRLITICNWDKYQGLKNGGDKADDKARAKR